MNIKEIIFVLIGIVIIGLIDFYFDGERKRKIELGLLSISIIIIIFNIILLKMN